EDFVVAAGEHGHTAAGAQGVLSGVGAGLDAARLAHRRTDARNVEERRVKQAVDRLVDAARLAPLGQQDRHVGRRGATVVVADNEERSGYGQTTEAAHLRVEVRAERLEQLEVATDERGIPSRACRIGIAEERELRRFERALAVQREGGSGRGHHSSFASWGRREIAVWRATSAQVSAPGTSTPAASSNTMPRGMAKNRVATVVGSSPSATSPFFWASATRSRRAPRRSDWNSRSRAPTV